ncbi:hypothetical protein LWE61_07025 [Sphingobium sufflavum]|uniref:hypothetical protein n=1 Tax=Sphingobium sufflavum TaxID=1129547 RepID=UPI001F206DC5|nr:hypothetical protein [Sphingobium sufflavum]MCE7796314.1 hypothetical protein [Sphingobium sufflavum]
MIGALLLLAAAPPTLGFDTADFGEDAVLYAAPVEKAGSEATAAIAWPRGAALRVDMREDEALVHFDRPVDEASVARFEAEVGAFVQTLRWNDDSLLLRANPGVRLSARVEGNRLLVTFAGGEGEEARPASGSVPEDGAGTDARDARDMAMVAIRADLASGFTGSARRQAERLAARHPQDRDVARLMADTQAADGDHGVAARAYRRADATDPAARRAMALAPGSVSLGGTIRDGSGFTQTEAALRATVATGDGSAVTGAVRHVGTRADSAMAADGLHSGIDTDATLADLIFTTRIAPALRVDLSGGVWLDTGVAGGGVRMVYGSSDTQLRVGYVHHMPDLSLAEQALGGGFLSQFSLGGSAQLLPELRSRFDFGWRRYGLSGLADAGETLTLAGQVDYILLRRPVAVSLGYRLDAEYVRHLAYGPGGLARLPLSDRENHTLQAFASSAIGPVLVTGGAGWTVDRFGGSGPNASLSAGAPVGTRWQVDAGLGLTSISRPGFPGRQMFGRLEVRRALGDGR